MASIFFGVWRLQVFLLIFCSIATCCRSLQPLLIKAVWHGVESKSCVCRSFFSNFPSDIRFETSPVSRICCLWKVFVCDLVIYEKAIFRHTFSLKHTNFLEAL